MVGTRRVVVTGGGGRIAKVLAPVLAAEGWAVDAPGHGEMDVTDVDAVRRRLEELRPDAVVNLAAMTDVDACELDPALAEAVNVDAVTHLAELCDHVGAHLVHLSSDYVFDGASSKPFLESDEARPLSVYGRTKLAGESAAGPVATVVRTAWVSTEFGPSPVHAVLSQAVDPGRRISYISDQVGSPTSASDLAGVLAGLLAERVAGLFHVTNAGSASWYELARFVLEQAGVDPDRVEPVLSEDYLPRLQAARPGYSVLDSEALPAAGWPTLRHWHEAFAELVDRVVVAGRA